MYATIRYELCNGLIGGFLKAPLDERMSHRIFAPACS
jgi:hypothetical protein